MVPSPSVVFDSKSRRSDMIALGFGFDSVSDDYKVVRVAYTVDDRNKNFVTPKVEGFSVSSGVWRFVENSVGCYINELWNQVFFKGAVYWCAYKKSSNNTFGRPYRNFILRFNLDTEKFDELGLPEDFDCYPPTSIYVTTVGGRFGVFCTNFFMRDWDPENFIGYCRIFVMKEYGKVDSWNDVFSIESVAGLSKLLGFKSDGECLFSGEDGELVSYDFGNEMVTFTGVLGTKGSFFVDKYVESLALLDKGSVFEGKNPELDNEDEDQTVDEAEKKS